ncbi:MAG: hypothetical protein A2X17_04410 [Bacteroidetes bacterium GWF2_41_61]|nr:MAG: hypothetical protein A2X17_04410 [Bacteroidetes bacterium GWF2_41_61]OFY91136.1 MAG: hypothetical protein A2266_01600 [Bacteroidetes bacterium RIFOXYA12_FULL_40_10]
MIMLKKSLEQEFFEIAFNLHYERLVVYIYRYCKDWGASENLAQETFREQLMPALLRSIKRP